VIDIDIDDIDDIDACQRTSAHINAHAVLESDPDASIASS
jgi:hypothetical protein